MSSAAVPWLVRSRNHRPLRLADLLEHCRFFQAGYADYLTASERSERSRNQVGGRHHCRYLSYVHPMRRVELGSYATRKTDLDLHTRANKFVSKCLFPVARAGMLSTPGRRLCDQEVRDGAG
jgi:hypothetical protein